MTVTISDNPFPINDSYYYAALNGSEYSFAFALGDNDKIFRRAQEPADPAKDVISVFNLLIEYTSDIARCVCVSTLQTLGARRGEELQESLARVCE